MCGVLLQTLIGGRQRQTLTTGAVVTGCRHSVRGVFAVAVATEPGVSIIALPVQFNTLSVVVIPGSLLRAEYSVPGASIVTGVRRSVGESQIHMHDAVRE